MILVILCGMQIIIAQDDDCSKGLPEKLAPIVAACQFYNFIKAQGRETWPLRTPRTQAHAPTGRPPTRTGGCGAGGGLPGSA